MTWTYDPDNDRWLSGEYEIHTVADVEEGQPVLSWALFRRGEGVGIYLTLGAAKEAAS